MHLYDVERGKLGANAVVGGGPSVDRRRGLAFKFRNEPRVAVASSARRHEHRHFSRVAELASSGGCRVFVCEPQQVGRSTPSWQAHADQGHLQGAAAYDIEGDEGHGQDVEAV